MAVSEVFLLRHGETHWNMSGRFQGSLDSPLTEKGINQAASCGRRLATLVEKVDAFHASPLGRAAQTTSIIRSFRDYPETCWEPRLAEVSLGSWDGLTDIDIDALSPGSLDGATPFDWYFRSPDGESYDAAMERVKAWLNDLDGVTVAVSHGLVGRLIRGAYLGLPKDAALSLPVPQDVIWHLKNKAIEAVS